LRLALELRFPSVDAMLADPQMTSLALSEWQAFEALNGPIGPAKFDDLFRFLAAAVGQVKNLDDFIPHWWKTRVVTVEEMTPREYMDAVIRKREEIRAAFAGR